MRDQEMVERILALSSKALEEGDRGAFISCLRERATLIAHISGNVVEAREEALRVWLKREAEVSARLEKERLRVLREMDRLSARRMAVRQYSSKFPFPPMPVFFDKKG
ncbi:MAG: hypothetical protein ABSC19_04745 [Syntrophorhabdales bacterium]|jgi:hypothetical protein